MPGNTPTRREAIGGIAAASAVATAALAQTSANTMEDPAAQGRAGARARYRETDHVRAFYRVNCYPCQGERTC